MGRIKVKGMVGALALSLAYGTLSGTRTVDYIAPLLTIITIQQKVLSSVRF